MKSTDSSKGTISKSKPMYQADWKALAFVYVALVIFDHFVFDNDWGQAVIKIALIMTIFWSVSWAIGTFRNNKGDTNHG